MNFANVVSAAVQQHRQEEQAKTTTTPEIEPKSADRIETDRSDNSERRSRVLSTRPPLAVAEAV